MTAVPLNIKMRRRAKHPAKPQQPRCVPLGVSRETFESLRVRGVIHARVSTVRPLPHCGPFRVVGGETSVPVWSRHAQAFVSARINGEDYGIVMHRRWHLDSAGYPWTRYWDHVAKCQRPIYLHRLIARATGDIQVDHIGHDLLDCRRDSLRLATPAENTANRRRPTLHGTSRYRGVTRSTATRSLRWQAQAAGYIGLFKCEIQAARAYDEVARRKWGEFARTNFDAHGNETNEVAEPAA